VPRPQHPIDAGPARVNCLPLVPKPEHDRTKPPLTLCLAAPRGFCAGVDRAIKIVEMALDKWGAPVYVRHEIVHNKFVVDELRDKGAIFVEELDECPLRVTEVLLLFRTGLRLV
jgi:hypothetical protein